MTGWHPYPARYAESTESTCTISGTDKAWGSAPRISWQSPYVRAVIKAQTASTATERLSEFVSLMS